MLSPLTPEFIERFEAIVESDKPVANKFAESLILIFDERLKAESGGEPSRMAAVMRKIGMVDSAAIVAQLTPISFLDRGHRALRNCPRCGEDCSTIGITKTAYTFESCDCDDSSAAHPHLVEQLWHRACIRRPAPKPEPQDAHDQPA
jgi:hypothetical protein